MKVPMPRTMNSRMMPKGTQRISTGSLSMKVPSRNGLAAAGSATSVAADSSMPRMASA